MDDFAVFSRRSSAAASASSRAATRWCGSATPSRTTASALPRAPRTAAACQPRPIDVVVERPVHRPSRSASARTASARPRRAWATPSRSIPNIKMPTVWRANIGFQTEVRLRRRAGSSAAGASTSTTSTAATRTRSRSSTCRRRLRHPRTAASNRARLRFTIDGRPIYARSIRTSAGLRCRSSVGPSTAPARSTPTLTARLLQYRRRDDELMLTNARRLQQPHRLGRSCRRTSTAACSPGGSTSTSASAMPTPTAQDRRNMYNSTAGSNYDLTAAFDRQNPTASRGFYGSRHNISLSTAPSARSSSATSATTFGFTLRRPLGPSVQPDLHGRRRVQRQRFGQRQRAASTCRRASTIRTSRRPSNMAAVQQLVDFASGSAAPRSTSAARSRATPARTTGTTTWTCASRRRSRAWRVWSASAARQDQALRDVRQLPEPARQRLERPASPQLRRPSGHRFGLRRRRPGPLHHHSAAAIRRVQMA